MYKKIQSISSIFNKEDENPNDYLSKETQEKYKIFKKWLIDNGAIFQKNIDFPYTYGPFHIVGCKCISDIKDDEGILLVPKNLMIMGKDLTYLNKLIQDVKDELTEREDLSTLFLTLNLYLEKDKKDSFFKPYIDLIYTNKNYFATWNDKTFSDLQNIYIAQSIKNLIDSMDSVYDILIKCKAFSKMKREDYSFCYFQVISRQFYLDKHNSALIPLADLLNHNSVTIHYEIYDGENMVFKYSDHFTVDEDIKIDIKPTYLKEIPTTKPTYNKIKPIIPKKERYLPNEEEDESDDEDDTIVNLNINDYFCISTSLNQKMDKGSQAFNNYCNINNKSLLKYYGFALINNVYDYTDVIFQFDKNDSTIKTYLPHLFKKRFKTDLDEKYNLLKIRCEYKSVCADLIKYYQFMYYYDINKIDEFFDYKFNYQLELASVELSIHGLEIKLKMMENKNTFEQELEELEKQISKKEPELIKVNILIYRITQKINIKNQIELLKFFLSMLIKHKDIKKYEDLFQYLNELKNISEYDNEEDAKMKIISFIEIMNKAKS